MGTDTSRPLDVRARWLSITAATVVMQFSYWPLLLAVTTADQEVEGGGALALGLAVMPLVFVVLAFTSRHRHPPGAVLRAMGLFILIGLPVALLDVLLGSAVGYAAGGAVALRREPNLASSRARLIAVGATGLWLLVLLVVAPSFAVMSGAALPLAVHGIADQVVEDRAEARGSSAEPTS